MELYIAGGCGEHGRSCFLVRGEQVCFLVDCGVMASEGPAGVPRLSQEQILALQCVFLTHSHADHTGALPWLWQQGYRGPVVATCATLAQLPFLMDGGMTLDELEREHHSRLHGIEVQWGRSGHCEGSVWYRFTAEGKSIVFSGDYTEQTQVYAYDPLRNQQADFAVLDCAYGTTGRSYVTCCGQLMKQLPLLLQQYSTLALPVPKYGRGLELLRLLQGYHPEYSFGGDAHFLQQVAKLAQPSPWFKEELTLQVEPVADRLPQLLFISDPQLRSEAAQALMDRVLQSGGIGLATGTVEAGSYSEELLRRKKLLFFSYPVHLNASQYAQLLSSNYFQAAIPYHSAELTCESVYEF